MPNLVPVDKFRPQNVQKAVEYVKVLSTLCPERVKFGDEKSLKGADFFKTQSADRRDHKHNNQSRL